MKTYKTGEVFSLAKQIQLEEGKAVKKLVINGEAMKLLLVGIDHGELPAHTAPMNGLISVLEGEGTFFYLGKSFAIHQGDNFAFQKDQLHAIKTDSKIKFSVLLWKEGE